MKGVVDEEEGGCQWSIAAGQLSMGVLVGEMNGGVEDFVFVEGKNYEKGKRKEKEEEKKEGKIERGG